MIKVNDMDIRPIESEEVVPVRVVLGSVDWLEREELSGFSDGGEYSEGLTVVFSINSGGIGVGGEVGRAGALTVTR